MNHITFNHPIKESKENKLILQMKNSDILKDEYNNISLKTGEPLIILLSIKNDLYMYDKYIINILSALNNFIEISFQYTNDDPLNLGDCYIMIFLNKNHIFTINKIEIIEDNIIKVLKNISQNYNIKQSFSNNDYSISYNIRQQHNKSNNILNDNIINDNYI
jgi:hypothetical protein